MHLRLAVAAALALSGTLLLPACPALAQDSGDRVKAEARVLPEAGIPAGGKGRLEVTLAIDPAWHIYGAEDANATSLSLSAGTQDLEIGRLAATTAPRDHRIEGLDETEHIYEGSVTYAAEVKVPAGTAVGERTLEGVADVFACDAGSCLPPGKVAFRATLKVLAAGTAVAPLPPPASPPEEDEGLLFFLLAAIGGGLLTILTPCVFPMIPLTVSLLTKRAEAEPARIVPNAISYAAGMFVSLAGLGLAATLLLNTAPTELTQSAWFNLAIFAFLVYLALSLFGAYDIALPAFLTNWSQSKAGTGGGAGLFFMGMTLAFTSFACAAPFAGALLVKAREDLVHGALGMSVYAASFSAPFFLLALFPKVLRKLPRSGGWLNAVKVVMGFVEVAAAFKFLRGADIYWEWGIFSRSVVLGVWAACSIGAAVYLLGGITLPHDTKVEGIGVGRMLWSLFFIALAAYFLPGVFRRPLDAYTDSFVLVSPDEPLEEWARGGAADRGGNGAAKLAWIKNDLEAALAEAKRSGKPVFVDFTGLT